MALVAGVPQEDPGKWRGRVIKNPALGVLLLVLPTLAQDRLVEQAPAASPMSARVLLVVDVSGSMDAYLPRALTQVADITGQPVDELQLACIAFSDQVYRWPRGWVQLPDEGARGELLGWLGGLGARGDTLLAPALRLALEEEGDLTVIVISDGMFQRERLEPLRDLIREGLEGRESPARVATLCVRGRSETMARLGEAGGGGAWSLESPQ